MNDSASILLLVSDPLDLSISIQRDLLALQDALRELDCAVTFDVRIAEADAVQSHLAQGDRPRYAALHYLGHGYKPKDEDSGALAFEKIDGASDELDRTRLSYTLASAAGEFKLAVISACYSESIAASLFAVGVEHVIAIEDSETVSEVAAVAFCRRFYQSLLTGRSLDESFTIGRQAIFTDPVMRLMGNAKTQAEVAKFNLLSCPERHAAQFFLTTVAGQTELQGLPALTQPPFDQQPLEFIGRNADMRELIQKLNLHRAAVVLGVSGVGKTELAKQTARRFVARRRVKPEHVAFASLVNAKSAADARAEIALALGLPPDGIADNGALQRAMPRHRMLVLDEAENVIACDGLQFRQLLDAVITAPSKPFVIVTSQTNPNTPKAPPVQLHRLSEGAALQLFAANTGLGWEQFQRINRAHLIEVLESVGRLPRAIELIAKVWWQERGGDSGNMDLTSLVEKLRAAHDLVMADPDYPHEVKSVTVGVKCAYDRLMERSPAAAQLWTQLALFPGGVAKAGLPQIFGPEAAALANEIEKQSLVESAYGHFPAPFGHLLELPTPFRFFALRHLPAGDEAAARQAIGEAVLQYYFNFPEESHRGWIGLLDQSMCQGGKATSFFISRFRYELPSIEFWLDWAYDHEPCRANRARAPRLTELLQNCYLVTNELRNQGARFDRALACALCCHDREGEASMLKLLGKSKWIVDDLLRAQDYYEQALLIFHEIENRQGEASTLEALGDLKKRDMDLVKARDNYEQALLIFREIGNRQGEANALHSLGELKLMSKEKLIGKDLTGAHADTKLALSIYRKIEDRLGEANALQTLGNLSLAEEQYDDAIKHLRQALNVYIEIPVLHNVGATLNYLARVANATEQHIRATLLFEFALKLARKTSYRLGQALTLHDQGKALIAQNLVLPALAAWWQARQIFAEIDDGRVQELDALFSEIEALGSSEEFKQLLAILRNQLEEARLAGVVRAEQTIGKDELIREIAEQLQKLDGE